ncbi:hypothetical protein [Amycolatopsis magusensis]|uniref:hypothetical protein n=1 Tax=Amycolatopsis magusensis TaxID=882444 RepID=UPI0037B9525D
MDALLNVVDVEATCWERQPPAGEVSEIGLTVEVAVSASTAKRAFRPCPPPPML